MTPNEAAHLHGATPSSGFAGGAIGLLRDTIVRVCEIAAALLLMSLCGLLLAGIAARYVFHYPLTWSDDIVAFNFIWLTMIASIVTYHRGQASGA